jgi:hypothetical protein
MKYLKKFNEELKAQTYKSAARKLKKILKEKPALGKAIGAEERANKLELYSQEVQEKQDIEAWKKEIEQFSKYGEFNIEMSRPGTPSIKPKVYSFYLDIVPEIEQMIESWDDEDPDNRELTFGFCAGLIPKTIEDREEIKMNFNNDYWNGHTWGFWIYPTYKVVNSEVTFKGLKIYNYDSSPNHQIADRKTAVALKRLLVNIFDPTFDYPSGYKDVTNMYDKIEQSAIQGLEISATYGIDMGRIQEDIKKLPIMDFYIQ